MADEHDLAKVRRIPASSVLPTREKLHSIVLTQEEPFVFIGAISDWECARWDPEYIARELADIQTRFRFCAHRNTKFPVMETDCEFENGTFVNFCYWLKGDKERAGALAHFERADYWCYAGYKYMAELFKDLPHLRHAVDWSTFGFPGRTGDESTIWIGSQGASTPCHFDSYGCNLVAQIYGTKKWTLFPPSDTDRLYPTRVPYEESSVFSQVNIVNPDLKMFPNFGKAVRHEVILKPGDVLFVPKHWWHYVESQETSISVNTWIELESDNLDRVHEAITRTLVSALKRAEGVEENTWINPSEEMGTHDQNMGYLQQSLERLHHDASKKTLEKTGRENKRQLVAGVVSTDDFINCMASPEVLRIVRDQLLTKLGMNLVTSSNDPGMFAAPEPSRATQAGCAKSVTCTCANSEDVGEHSSVESDTRTLTLKRSDNEPDKMSAASEEIPERKKRRTGLCDEAK